MLGNLFWTTHVDHWNDYTCITTHTQVFLTIKKRHNRVLVIHSWEQIYVCPQHGGVLSYQLNTSGLFVYVNYLVPVPEPTFVFLWSVLSFHHHYQFQDWLHELYLIRLQSIFFTVSWTNNSAWMLVRFLRFVSDRWAIFWPAVDICLPYNYTPLCSWVSNLFFSQIKLAVLSEIISPFPFSDTMEYYLVLQCICQ